VSRYVNHSKMAYTVPEAAEMIAISRAQMYRLIDLGEIESIKVGRSRRVTSRQLDAFLEAQETREEQPTGFSFPPAKSRRK
jgi:excisionase family DNA binding protein